MIWLVPAATPLATPPVPLIVAADSVPDDQVTALVTSCDKPSVKVPVALKLYRNTHGQCRIARGERVRRHRFVRQAERGRTRVAAAHGRDSVTSAEVVCRGSELAQPVALMVAGFPPRVAEPPLAGGVNVTRPPDTGSIGLLALTVATSGAERRVAVD